MEQTCYRTWRVDKGRKWEFHTSLGTLSQEIEVFLITPFVMLMQHSHVEEAKKCPCFEGRFHFQFTTVSLNMASVYWIERSRRERERGRHTLYLGIKQKYCDSINWSPLQTWLEHTYVISNWKDMPKYIQLAWKALFRAWRQQLLRHRYAITLHFFVLASCPAHKILRNIATPSLTEVTSS